MFDNLPYVPPALLLILNELQGCTSQSDARRRLKGMLSDLRDQSEVFQLENIERKGYSRNPLHFDIHLHGALDLLSSAGCSDLRCRVQAAERLARSVGLVADHVWMTDLLSERFIEFGRATNAKLDAVLDDVLVLSGLLPLILAGVVRFRPPIIHTCTACHMAFNNQVEITAAELHKKFRRDFKVNRQEGGGFIADTGKCFEPRLYFHSIDQIADLPNANEFAKHTINEELHSIFWTAREASITGGAVFSNSRLGLAGLLQNEGRLPDRRSLIMFDKDRELNVPWVSELNALQIVQLRQEASKALPAFREQISKALSAPDLDHSNSPDSIISELREQSHEVRSELEAQRTHSSRYWKSTYSLLGLGLSAYGIATDQIFPGVAGLLPVLQLLIAHNTGHETEIAKLTSRPGFVLVKAQDILAHAR